MDLHLETLLWWLILRVNLTGLRECQAKLIWGCVCEGNFQKRLPFELVD